MKREMTAFDVLAMSQEMQCLVGGFVDKVFHWDRRSVLFRINAPAGRRELLLKDGKWLYMPQDRPETPDTPGGFAVHLRKMLNNARVTAVWQREFDRIIVLDMGNREGTYQVIFELFGEGNLLVVQDGKIANCIEQKTWRHRDIRIGIDYQFPPSRPHPLLMDLTAWREALSVSTADTVRTLATAGNMGGQYAEEACLVAGVDKNRKAKTLVEEDIVGLSSAIKQLFLRLDTPQPTVYYGPEHAVDVAPIALLQDAALEAEAYPTFSDALDEYIIAKAPDAEDVRDEELERLLRQREQQAESVDRLRAESLDLADKANHLYARYAEVVKLLSVLGKKADELNWEQMRDFAQGLPFCVKVEPDKDMIVVRIDEAEVPLNYRLSIDENANLLFSHSKEAKEKMRGAEQALMETEKKVEDRQRHGQEVARAAKAKAKPTKQFWFETYRWFMSSQNRLVLGGRDARSNEQLVKKHLGDPDRYAHADLHGAASVIIKNGSEAGEEEMRQVCTFALASSKAWGAGVSEGSAYWVVPDQVSKTPEAGEFVPRGGFIIRGRRNYFHHLPLRLAVGEIEHEGARKIMCGPEEAVRARSSRFIVIVPGELARGKLSAQLAKVFEVPEEEISRILPPGDVEVVERFGLEM